MEKLASNELWIFNPFALFNINHSSLTKIMYIYYKRNSKFLFFGNAGGSRRTGLILEQRYTKQKELLSILCIAQGLNYCKFNYKLLLLKISTLKIFVSNMIIRRQCGNRETLKSKIHCSFLHPEQVDLFFV